ncbi:MAG: ATP-binding cassette domain-containing protein [Halofilum sp. (in: g-proteobacteria)]|nr:ATP-binding cassette domain-containing protein [Halofilum sp. (in: g-proteobacteria)]
MSAEPQLLEALDLYRDFGAVRAVAGVDLSLGRGQVLGLLGPNGAGKTTTLQLVCGVLAPHAGCIRIDGIDLLERPRTAKAALGYLPEQPPLYADMTVDEYLGFCAALHGVGRDRRAPLRQRALERCGLADVRQRLIGNLSQGYRQRVGIAQAILHEPAVIVLDEPTVGLDPIQIREIRRLIAELGRDHGVVLSTHILAEVEAVCSHVQIMHQGRTVHVGTVPGADRMEGHGDVLGLRLRAAVTREAIAALPGVTSAESLGGHRWRLELAPRARVDALAAGVVERGWGLLELTPEVRSLEQIFIEATTRDPESATAVGTA